MVKKLLKHEMIAYSRTMLIIEAIVLGFAIIAINKGYSVPKDISVVSFNDTPRSELFSPSLTSVSIDAAEMANVALRLVSERAVLPDKEPIRTIPLKVVVPPRLVERESSAEFV